MTRRPLFSAVVLTMLCTSCVRNADAQGTHLWSQSSAADFERGTPDGIAISSLGQLEPGPEAHAVLTTGSTFVWSVAADAAGNAYLATGSPAGVTRVSHAEGDGAPAQTRIFTTKDLTVQVVRMGPDGALYAATLPSGRVYRLDPGKADQDEAQATVVFDPAQTAEKAKYVWDLAFDREGRLYVATGAPGTIYRIKLPRGGAKDGASKPEIFYSSDEPHIRALLFDVAGTLFAGSDGSGLVYRITPEGTGFVLFEAARREVTALALGSAGQLYVAAVGERGHTPLPPLPVTGAASVTATITFAQPGSVQAFNGNTVIPDGSEVYEIPGAGAKAGPPNQAGIEGAPHRLWASHDDIVYALRATDEGLLAATGNRGHIYRIAEDGSHADIAHLLASQVTGFAENPAGLYAATANTGKLYVLSHGAAARGTFESDVFDAQVRSLWGRAEVLGSGGYELYARSGNVENPLRGWTEWKRIPANDPEGSGARSLTPARYLQWKAVLSPGGRISSVGMDYLPGNVPPVVDDFVVAPGTRVNAQASMPQVPQSTSISFGNQQAANGFEQSNATGPLAAIRDKSAVTARWAAHDDNGDELTFALFYRSEGDGSQTWRLLKDKLTERFYTFDASVLPDGAYRMKVVASDAPSHTPGDAISAERESASFLIDTATPQVSAVTAVVSGGSLHVTATATDVATPIARAEYSVDAGPWQYVEPVGRLSGGLLEHYDFHAPLETAKAGASAEHTVTLRVFDRYDNVAAAKAVAR